MPKFGTKKPAKKRKVKPSTRRKAARVEAKLGVPSGDPDLICSDDTEDQQEIVVVQGRIGSGKSIFAATASEFALKGKLTAKKKWAKLTELDDMFWAMYDRRALAGLKSLGMRVRNVFDIYNIMGEYECDIIDAGQRMIDKAADSDCNWVVIDTVSTMDARMLTHHTKATLDHANNFEAYKRNLFAHGCFVDDLISIGKSIIFLTHSRIFDVDKDKQMKQFAISIAGGGEMVPDLTGQAPKHYKRDSSLQIVMHAFRDPKTRKITRQALIGINDQGEGKNRYEGILPDVQEPPHLRQLLELAWA